MDRRCGPFFLCYVTIIYLSGAKCYTIPDVRIELLDPKGLRASIPDSPDLSLFAFHANVRREIKPTDVGAISGEVLRADQGRWTFVDLDVDVKEGDVINYYVHVIAERVGYVRDNLVYVADEPRLNYFHFHAKLNLDSRTVSRYGQSEIGGEIFRPHKGRWTFVNPDVKLKAGDIVYYSAIVRLGDYEHFMKNFKYTVTGKEKRVPLEKLPDKPTTKTAPVRTTSKPSGSCRQTITQVQGMGSGLLCSGRTIFEEHFNSALDPLKWRIEHKIALDNPDTPFVSYQRSAVDINNGTLRISPTPLHTVPGHEDFVTSVLELDQCSSDREELCVFRPLGSNIPPPVVSGRVTSAFAFRYGTVHIRAKLPQGDWLFPEILLQPISVNYPYLYNKVLGVVKIAMARGNRELHDDYYRNFGNKFLQGGLLVVDKNGARYDFRQKTLDERMWGDQFHEYSVQWTPDNINLSVDGVTWGQIDYSRMINSNPQPNIGPFDQYLVISLGLAAGGDSVFPDDLTTGGNSQKPWRNRAAKAKVNFWKSTSKWYPTWSANSQFLVDYVKVVAL